MVMRVRDGAGTLRTIKAIRVRDADGILRVIKTVRVRDASNTLRTVFSSVPAALTVSLDKPNIIGEVTGATTSGTVTSDIVIATASNGTGPYTYAWTYLSGNVVTINAPTAQATDVSSTVSSNSPKYGRMKVTATDSLGVKGTAEVDYELHWYDNR